MGDNLGITMKFERRLNLFISPYSSKSGWEQGEEGFRAATEVMSSAAGGALSPAMPAEYAGGSLLDSLDMLMCDCFFSISSIGVCTLALVAI